MIKIIIERRIMPGLEEEYEEAAREAMRQSLGARGFVGGESLVVYAIGAGRRITTTFSGSKCASGTGEFLRQQLTRMDMRLSDVNAVPDAARVLPLSTRCSVFMKSDCTHRLN